MDVYNNTFSQQPQKSLSSKRSNMNNKYRSSTSSSILQQQQQQELLIEPSVSTSSLNKRSSMGYRRPLSTASTNNRYSRNSFLGDDDLDYDKRDYTVDYDHNEPQEDWENILRQYDRYSTNDDDRRKSKRASRIMESYQDMPVEVPIVDEPTTVLDCYDFPPAFKTHHLHDIFRSYETSRGGYRIKWLSDTRALIIFDHPATAKKAYIDNVTHALAKIRPYDGPIDFLKDNQQNQQPQQRRPMSMDNKRQSFNAYNNNGNGRNSNRNSMRMDENDIKRLSVAL
ncbi:uncharacterized protein B0P05DRAFT_549282 [Gilbertella persicaria]|uniref:uncharacterized protein n=1 Tax=Gilbertella persicaria TaxID=101096 RepID=UPI0022200C8B|nr:uncharacterized protein B0P05DRAFT_549282 [Gilbertella persicaria]KAI8072198.1 hypothetical protein B0P05DRAFT_549282 [Gilbertella persicaria]